MKKKNLISFSSLLHPHNKEEWRWKKKKNLCKNASVVDIFFCFVENLAWNICKPLILFFSPFEKKFHNHTYLQTRQHTIKSLSRNSNTISPFFSSFLFCSFHSTFILWSVLPYRRKEKTSLWLSIDFFLFSFFDCFCFCLSLSLPTVGISSLSN